MGEMTQSSLLTRAMLDEGRYAESLLEVSHSLGLIDEAFLHALSRSLQRLLADQCRAYTGGHSGSIRRETALSLGESILFTLGALLKRYEPLEALAMLRNESLENCYRDGRRQVDRLVQTAELMHRAELRRPLPVENEQLRDTLVGGISGFFKLYNPEYGAQEIHITADYPVLFYPQGLRGVEFILKYLDNLVMENRFLRLFETAPLHRCLNLYAIRNDTTLSALCDNLCEVTLACALRPLLPPKPTARMLPKAGYALMERLECPSSALRQYVIRICVEYASDLLRIQRLMREGSDP